MSTQIFSVFPTIWEPEKFALVCDSCNHRGSRYLCTPHHKPELFPSAEAAIVAGIKRSWTSFTNSLHPEPSVFTTCINCRNTP